MTSAYKKKLIEDKKWEYENMLGDKLDEKTDVRSSGMEGFYKNLLTKNISMGSSVDGNAVSVYTAGSTRQSKLQEEQQQQQPQEARAKDSEKASHLDDNRFAHIFLLFTIIHPYGRFIEFRWLSTSLTYNLMRITHIQIQTNEQPLMYVCIHTVHTYSTYIQYIQTYIQYTYVQYIHTVRTYIQYIHTYVHTVYT